MRMVVALMPIFSPSQVQTPKRGVSINFRKRFNIVQIYKLDCCSLRSLRVFSQRTLRFLYFLTAVHRKERKDTARKEIQ